MSPQAVIIGPPGAGKSTVGRLLAERLRVSFVDTDAEIEAVAGTSIADIFTTQGEPTFRQLEEQAVATGLAEHSGILALGGGAVISPVTRERLHGHAVVLLRVGLAEAAKRTGLSTARPLLAGVNPRATLKALLDERMPLYREVASVELDADSHTPSELAEQVCVALQLPSPA